MPRYQLVTQPSRIPVPGNKVIDEFFGRVNTQTEQFSLARMVAPPGWGEPAQTPGFGELTILLRGVMRIEVDGETVDLRAGQAVWIEPGVRVRYGNPFEEECEYWALCLPAFHPGLAGRE